MLNYRARIDQFRAIFPENRPQKENNLSPVRSLKNLLRALPEANGKDYVSLAQDMEIPHEDFQPYAFWSADFYTRNCLDRNENYELLLLCWQPGQETPIHCHNGEECWVYTIQGNLQEQRFDWQEEQQALKRLGTEKMRAGQVSYMNDNMGFHSLHNTGAQPAMTLHLYMKPIDRCRIYDEALRGFQYRELQYHSFKGEVLDESLSLVGNA